MISLPINTIVVNFEWGVIGLRKRWKLLLLIVLLGIAGTLSTYGVQTYFLYSKEPDQPAHIKVVETERSILALPHYIALAQGFYQEQNLDVEVIVPEKANEEGVTLKGQGNILLGNLCQSLFTLPLGTGPELVAFAGVASRDGSYLLGRSDAPVFSWEQMKRKTILGEAPDTQGNIILEQALREHKLTLQHQVIIIQNIPAKLKEGAFQAGVGHYVQMSQPLASQTELNGSGKTVAFLGSVVQPIPSLVLLAPQSYLSKQGSTCQKLVNGLCKGQLWLDYHKPEEAARVVAPYFTDLDKQTLTQIIDTYKKQGVWSKNPVIPEQAYDNLQTYVKNAGELTNPVVYGDGVYAKLAKKAVGTVEYIPPELQKEKTWWEKVKTLDFK